MIKRLRMRFIDWYGQEFLQLQNPDKKNPQNVIAPRSFFVFSAIRFIQYPPLHSLFFMAFVIRLYEKSISYFQRPHMTDPARSRGESGNNEESLSVKIDLEGAGKALDFLMIWQKHLQNEQKKASSDAQSKEIEKISLFLEQLNQRMRKIVPIIDFLEGHHMLPKNYSDGVRELDSSQIQEAMRDFPHKAEGISVASFFKLLNVAIIASEYKADIESSLKKKFSDDKKTFPFNGGRINRTAFMNELDGAFNGLPELVQLISDTTPDPDLLNDRERAELNREVTQLREQRTQDELAKMPSRTKALAGVFKRRVGDALRPHYGKMIAAALGIGGAYLGHGQYSGYVGGPRAHIHHVLEEVNTTKDGLEKKLGDAVVAINEATERGIFPDKADFHAGAINFQGYYRMDRKFISWKKSPEEEDTGGPSIDLERIEQPSSLQNTDGKNTLPLEISRLLKKKLFFQSIHPDGEILGTNEKNTFMIKTDLRFNPGIADQKNPSLYIMVKITEEGVHCVPVLMVGHSSSLAQDQDMYVLDDSLFQPLKKWELDDVRKKIAVPQQYFSEFEKIKKREDGEPTPEEITKIPASFAQIGFVDPQTKKETAIDGIIIGANAVVVPADALRRFVPNSGISKKADFIDVPIMSNGQSEFKHKKTTVFFNLSIAYSDNASQAVVVFDRNVFSTGAADIADMTGAPNQSFDLFISPFRFSSSSTARNLDFNFSMRQSYDSHGPQLFVNDRQHGTSIYQRYIPSTVVVDKSGNIVGFTQKYDPAQGFQIERIAPKEVEKLYQQALSAFNNR